MGVGASSQMWQAFEPSLQRRLPPLQDTASTAQRVRSVLAESLPSGRANIAEVSHKLGVSEGPDGRALGVTWDGGDVAYVVYTIVGGGSALESATQGGWIPAYAPGAISGGGPKVSYVGRVDVADGSLMSGTFVIAVKSDNKVNSHSVSGPVTVLKDKNVEFLGSSAHKPIDVDLTAMDCTDYPFESRYVLTPDLTAVVCAQSTNCTSQRPCG